MKNLKFEISGSIGIIKIDRGNVLNALNKETVSELDKLVQEVEKNTKIRVLIIGSKDNFAAGADIKEMAGCNVQEAKMFSFSKTFDRIQNLKIPTIAAIEGYALGGGLELALTCDFRIAAQNSKLGFPEINLGIMPGAGGTVRAARLVGECRAKQLILFGEIIDACRAEQIGLVNKTVENEKLMETVMTWAEKLSQKAPIALRTAKETIEKGMTRLETGDALEIEGENWSGLFGTEDQKEGMQAFIEKRRPVYHGK